MENPRFVSHVDTNNKDRKGICDQNYRFSVLYFKRNFT